MLKKANQKRRLDELVIAEGDFTTDYLQKLDWRDYLDENQLAELGVDGDDPNGGGPSGEGPQQSAAEIRQALAAAEDEEDAVAAKAAVAELEVDQSDFSEHAAAGAVTAGGVALGKVVREGSASASPAVVAEEEEEEEDELKGTIDGYMLNTVEEYYDDLA